MKPVAEFKTALPFVLAVVGLAAVGALSYRNFAEQQNNQQRVEQTLTVLDELEDLQSLLQYALRGARAYLLSGDREFVELYEWATIQLQPRLDGVRNLMVDSSSQQQRLRLLAPLVTAELNATKRVMSRYQHGQIAPSAEQDAARELQWIEGRLDRLIWEMRREAERRLKAHQASATTSARTLANLGMAFAGLAVLVVGLVGAALWRDTKARRRFEAALKESEARNRAILNTAQDAVITFNDQGAVESVNPAAERMFGYSAEEVIGRSYTLLMPEPNRERSLQRLERYIATGHGLIATGQEDLGLRKDGSGFPFEYSVGEMELANGRYFTAVMRDISRRKRVEESLREASAKLLQSNRDLENFATVASHDLQEPLRKIQTFGERLQVSSAAKLGGEGLDYLSRMIDAACRMRTLIQDLLTLSRVSAKSALWAPVDLAQVAREVVADLELRINQSQARVEIGALPTIEADALQMRQLLQNLIGNALKYRRPEEPPLVRVSNDDSTAAGESETGQGVRSALRRITVEDNGIGFEEKYLDRIFNPFQRLHGRGRYEGSGIGLSICRRIVERHGGTITARSMPGRGSTFIVCLPSTQHSEKKVYGEAA
jgi:two-component system, LuxR family, sensor kinase FixL